MRQRLTISYLRRYLLHYQARYGVVRMRDKLRAIMMKFTLLKIREKILELYFHVSRLADLIELWIIKAKYRVQSTCKYELLRYLNRDKLEKNYTYRQIEAIQLGIKHCSLF